MTTAELKTDLLRLQHALNVLASLTHQTGLAQIADFAGRMAVDEKVLDVVCYVLNNVDAQTLIQQIIDWFVKKDGPQVVHELRQAA